MATEGFPAERLRAFLRDLGPEAKSLLVTELERSALRGNAIPGASAILAELRPSLPQIPKPPPRIGNPSRLFFRPLQPFLVDRNAVRVLVGRIERASLEPLWNWISGTLLPDPARDYCEAVTAALLAGDDAAVRQIAQAFQDRVVAAVRAVLDRAAADERYGRRLAAQIRTERALEELSILHDVLAHQHALASIAARIPSRIRGFSGPQVDAVLAVLEQNLANRDAALRPALLLVAQRLDAFHTLIRLAIRSAESDFAAKVAQSRFAPAVDLVLAEMRGTVETLRDLCRRGLFAEALVPLKEIHDAVRAVRTELDLQADSAWGRELAAIRVSVADLLTGEIENIGGWTRRLLRPLVAREVPGGLDPREIAEVEGRIGLVAACRHYAGELAVNRLATRVHAELQACLDAAISSLIESLRHAEGEELRLRRAQAEAAIRFAGKLFGSEYAALLTKAAAMARAEAEAGHG